ncbi:MAG: PaaI family thioesterase [Myxococcales bacterium]|nr:PaaI family thioesterase [Myxococcales bacterium]MCB9628593.1 PaaI family thioesterase [Sandaracinaceae bacterium]
MSDDSKDYAAGLNERLGGYDSAIGLRFVSATLDEIVAEVPVTAAHHQPYGLVHGGVYAGIVETVCSVGAALNALQYGRSAVGLENATSFVRAARDGTLRARALPLVRGRRTQVWEARIEDQEGHLLAHGKVRLLCLESGAAMAGEVVHADKPALTKAPAKEG